MDNDYSLEDTQTYTKFSARPATRWNDLTWGVWVWVSDGTDSAGAVFSIEEMESMSDLITKVIAEAKARPPIALTGEEF